MTPLHSRLHPCFRWVSPDGVFAVLLRILASAAFAIYLANFADFNKTYGGSVAFV